MCGCLSHAPHWGSGLQFRHVPWLGIELVTLWFAGQNSIHWATPARAKVCILYPHQIQSGVGLLHKPVWFKLCTEGAYHSRGGRRHNSHATSFKYGVFSSFPSSSLNYHVLNSGHFPILIIKFSDPDLGHLSFGTLLYCNYFSRKILIAR